MARDNAMLNVAQGAPVAMRRGTALPRSLLSVSLASSVLLLASGASGRGFRRNSPEGLTVEGVSDVAEGGVSDAAHTVGGATEQAEDTGRLVKYESEKVQDKLRAKMKKNFVPPSLAWDGETNYLIASFPELRAINYVRLPDMTWRPLVITGIMSPKSIVIDEERARMYVADTALAKIFWYQLIVLPDKTLISDGRQHVAVAAVNCRNIALDLQGELWFSGSSAPLPPVPSID